MGDSLGINTTFKDRTADARTFESTLAAGDQNTFVFDSKNFKKDLVFNLRDGRIVTSKDGRYAFATIAGTDKRVAICVKADYSRGARAGNMFEVDSVGLFSAENLIPNANLEIAELQLHLSKLTAESTSTEEKQPATSSAPAIFTTGETNVPPQTKITVQAMEGNLQLLKESPEVFMQGSDLVLSGSHGCIHLSPGDAKKIESWVKVGAKITIFEYGRPAPDKLPPYLEGADFQVDPSKVKIEIYPKPGKGSGGIGIIYYKGEAVGYFKLTGGPEKSYVDKMGNEATPTKPCEDKPIVAVGAHLSGRYDSSKIPGGAQIRTGTAKGDTIETTHPITGKKITVPNVYYREFNYSKGVYEEPAKWIKAPEKFVQHLVKRGALNEKGFTDTSEYPLETRYIKSRCVTYYIGSDFGNGEVLPSGERMPHITMNWGTSEFIHYGGTDESEKRDLERWALEFMRQPEGEKADAFLQKHAALFKDFPSRQQKVLKYLRTIEKLKTAIFQQAHALKLTPSETQKIVNLYFRGYTADAQALLTTLAEHRGKGREAFFLEPENFLPKGDSSAQATIDGIPIKINRTSRQYTITVLPSGDPATDYKNMREISSRFGVPEQVPKNLAAYIAKLENQRNVIDSSVLGGVAYFKLNDGDSEQQTGFVGLHLRLPIKSKAN